MPGALDLCTLAWGNQDGYVFLSERDPSLDKSDPDYWVDHSYQWPLERAKVAETLKEARTSDNDFYWSPGVFSKDERKTSTALPSDTLWSDLDESNPRELPDALKPAAYWETSPGRWQAIWKLPEPVEPETHRKINQALTYEIGADKGGWGLSKVLRIPGTPNHKYEDEPKVRLEKLNGRRVRLSSVADLVAKGSQTSLAQSGPQVEEGALPSVKATLRRKRVSPRTRRLLTAKRSQVHVGERSERLWELECGLAEAGWSTAEIVSAVRGSVWNKFAGRANELTQLTSEANKALAYVSSKGPPAGVSSAATADTLVVPDDEDDGLPKPVVWAKFDQDHQAITWVVEEVWGQSEVGFVSGAPKSYKSWISLDLGVSIASGTPFLGQFKTRQTPVLLIQEEDPRTVLQDRMVKVAGAKSYVWAKIKGPSRLRMRYDLPEELYVVSNQGFTVTNEDHMAEIEEFISKHGIGFVIMDPLMMIAGGFDEFKAFEVMDNVLKPLKRMRARTNAAIALVHHHTKSAGQQDARAMYGSVAFWAWEEAALHLKAEQPGVVTAERFSKHSQLLPLSISVGDTSMGWEPHATIGVASSSQIQDMLTQYEGGITKADLARAMGISVDVASSELNKLKDAGKVDERQGAPQPGKSGPRPKLWFNA